MDGKEKKSEQNPGLMGRISRMHIAGWIFTMMLGFMALMVFVEVPGNNKDILIQAMSIFGPGIFGFLGYQKGREDMKREMDIENG